MPQKHIDATQPHSSAGEQVGGERTFFYQFLRLPRDLLARDMFRAIKQYTHGKVLDVGGWDFFLTLKKKGVRYEHWTTLDNSESKLLTLDDPAFECVLGDGCNMQFANGTFDTVLNIQVLEHVFEPIAMVQEIGRVLTPGGHAIFLIPQTGYMHFAPYHYYNFTRFWIEEVMRRSDLEIIELKPIGGMWSSMAMHAIFFFMESMRLQGYSIRECRRPLLYYVLFPFMALTALCIIPLGFLLSMGDLTEAANNHLVVARKKSVTPHGARS
jgi:SAM-dependent methyltransferase